MSEAVRESHVRRTRLLAYITIFWNLAEALVSLLSGLAAGSVSLIGFGFDSLIEVASGGAVLWRMRYEGDPSRREAAEQRALHVIGWCFVALALYVTIDALHSLWTREVPEQSIPGIAITAISAVLMPILSFMKHRVGRALGSRTVLADSAQTDFCAYLSWIVLAGLLLKAFAGLWWADSVAALLLVPLIAREALESLRGHACSCHDDVES